MKTPWGASQDVRPIGTDGILVVSTASHGGFYVPDSQLSTIPAEHRTYAAQWSGDEHWFEEDVAAACVVAAFPHLFSKENLADALATINHYIPKKANG
jgi:hypothetical protein